MAFRRFELTGEFQAEAAPITRALYNLRRTDVDRNFFACAVSLSLAGSACVRRGAMTYIDSAVLDFSEWFCHKFQLLTGRTNVWLALQLTNLSIIVYFVWTFAYFWISDTSVRVFIALFCSGVWYALTQTIFKEPIEAYEKGTYMRVANGLRNPRRIRDAPLRISFLTLSLLFLMVLPLLWYPPAQAYIGVRRPILLLSYSLIALTTVILYLLACDPLPPCTGKVWEWLRGAVPARLAASKSAAGDA